MLRFSRLIDLRFSLMVCVLFVSTVATSVPLQSQEPGFFRPDALAASQTATTPGQSTQTAVFPPNTASTPLMSQGVVASPSALSPQISGYATSTSQSLPRQTVRVAQANSVPPGDRITSDNTGNGNNNTVNKNANDSPRIPIAKPESHSGRTSTKAPRTFWGSLVTMFGSLILVLGIFLLIAWGMKKIVPGQSVSIPNSVLQCLGQFPLTSRNRLYLLRFGKKLLLVSVSGDETSLICEVENEDEAAELMTQLKSVGQPVLSRGGRSQ